MNAFLFADFADLDGDLGGCCLASALRRALEEQDESAPAPAGGDDRDVHVGSPGAIVKKKYAAGAGTAPTAAAGGGQQPRGAGAVGGLGVSVLLSEFLMHHNDEAQLVLRRLQEQREEDEQVGEFYLFLRVHRYGVGNRRELDGLHTQL